MYRKICPTNLSEFYPKVWEKSPEVSTKYILLCSMAIIAIFLYIIFLKNSLRVVRLTLLMLSYSNNAKKCARHSYQRELNATKRRQKKSLVSNHWTVRRVADSRIGEPKSSFFVRYTRTCPVPLKTHPRTCVRSLLLLLSSRVQSCQNICNERFNSRREKEIQQRQREKVRYALDAWQSSIAERK